MILCTYEQRSQRIIDWVQTLLNITDEKDLKIVSVEATSEGYTVFYRRFDLNDDGTYMFQIMNSQILLLESFRQ
jgi:hypothetical protein